MSASALTEGPLSDEVEVPNCDDPQVANLTINAQKNLPDVILVDLKPTQPLLIFVEVVASDGPISDRRKAALERMATDGNFDLKYVAFVTAYLDRSGSPFKLSKHWHGGRSPSSQASLTS